MLGTKDKVNDIVEELSKPVDINVVDGQCIANRILKREVLNATANHKDAATMAAINIPAIDPALQKAVEQNNNIYEVHYYQELQSSVPIIGKIIILLKKIIRRVLFYLIQPVVDEQNAYNASVTRTLNILNNTVITQREIIGQQEKKIQTMQGMEQALRNELAERDTRHQKEMAERDTQLQEDMDIQNFRLQTMKARFENMDRNCTDVNLSSTVPAEEGKEIGIEQNVYGDIDYFAFENAFRGSQESIRKSQLPYVKYFKGKENVIDIGCGRGEFLKLLQEEGISATGVDLYDEFVLYCKDKGLQAVQGDAVAFLNQQKNDSLGGIFGAQIVEHLAAGQIEAICRLAYAKLQKGGCVILETPNPRCLSIYTNAFYVDPSHVKPVHPETMKYYMKQAGFTDIEIVYTESSRIDYQLPLLQSQEVHNLEEFNSGIGMVSELLFGSQDYAIIARK